jgi:hypothetical protein
LPFTAAVAASCVVSSAFYYTGQLTAVPFDNNVFKVACDGIRGISKGSCDWNAKCTNPALNETDAGCPFDGRAREAFGRCSAAPGYPQPGLKSDVFFCQDPPTQGRMVSLKFTALSTLKCTVKFTAVYICIAQLTSQLCIAKLSQRSSRYTSTLLSTNVGLIDCLVMYLPGFTRL